MPAYTPGLEKTYPVTVPGHLIRTKYYDGDGEIFAICGSPLFVEDHRVPSPSLGVWSLLETINSKFVNKWSESTIFDAWRALWINEYRNDTSWKWWRPNAPLAVRKWVDAGGADEFNAEDSSTWLEWDWQVWNYGNHKLKFDINRLSHYDDIRMWFELSFSGYEMIPKSGGGGSRYWFGAETIAGTIAAIGDKLNMTPQQVIWDVPMALLGHIAAQRSAQADKDSGVSRPKDVEHMKELFLECVERAKRGELHPWQIESPLEWKLDPLQVYLNPTLKEHYTRLQNQAKAELNERLNTNAKS